MRVRETVSILRIIRWLCGYVTVRLAGDNSAAFLNFCLQKKIAVWSVTKDGENILLNMSLSYYKNIRSLRREFGYDIIISHTAFIGLPKKILFINNRKSLAVGAAVFFSVIFAFSQFLWQIDIVGNKSIPDETIIAAYTELGVYYGMPRSEIDSYALRDRLPLLVRDISWCSFNLEGSKLTINITEVDEYDKTGKNEYSNLIAVKDGIVENMDIISGNKVVGIGSVVRRGDLLVSGAPELNSQQFTYSEGKVLAKTKNTFTVTIPKLSTSVQKTGRVHERTVVDIFGFKIPTYLDSVHYEYTSELVENKLKLFGGELPIKFIKRRFTEIRNESKIINREEAINDAKAKLLEEANKQKIVEMQILKQTVSETQENFTVVFECKCIENIAKIQKINIAS